jgi:O-antigen/teichoic acid export membrane protein
MVPDFRRRVIRFGSGSGRNGKPRNRVLQIRKRLSITASVQFAEQVEVKKPSIQLTASSLLARNATLNVLAEGWTFLVLVIAMPKLVAFLGETGFGLFSLAWVVIGYLTFLDIGVNRAATKFVSEHLAGEDDQSVRSVVRTAFIANLSLGLLGGLLVVLLSPYLIHSVFKVSPALENQARLTFYAVGVAVPVLLVQGILRAILSSYQRFGWINSVNAAATTAQWTGAVLLAWRGFGLAWVVGITVVARMLATVVYGLVLSRMLPRFHQHSSAGVGTIFQLLRFGSWVTVSQLISPVLVYLDRVLIASFVSLGAVTLYTVPYEVMTRLRLIPSSMMSTLYPAFSERGLEGQQAQLQHLYERTVRYLLLILLPGITFLVLLGSDVLTVWMGTGFARQTVAVLEILALGALANGMAYVPYNMLQAAGRPDLTGKFHLLELPFYLALCFVFVPRWGIAGAALASTVRFALDAALLFWAVRKYCHCSLKGLWTSSFRRTLAFTLVLGVALLTIRLTMNLPWIRLAAGVISLFIYFGAAWVLIIDKREKPGLSAAVRIFRSQPAS